MCLKYIRNFKENPNKIGYKIFNAKDNKIKGWIYNTSKVYKKNVWYNSKPITVLTGGSSSTRLRPTYKTGFHIYDDKKFAKRMKSCGIAVFEVKYKDIITKGMQDGTRVVVAKKMKIIKELK